MCTRMNADAREVADTLRAEALHGAGALATMLNHIGSAMDDGDHEVARVLCENEMVLRALLTMYLSHAADDLLLGSRG